MSKLDKSTNQQLNKSTNSCVPLLLSLAPLAFFWRATLGQVVLAEGDALAHHVPMRMLALHYLQQGYWPLWNAGDFAGYPFLGSMQSALFYPATWLFAVLPLSAAIDAQVMVSHAAAALGMYAYGRALGCGRYAASFAALTFAYAGFLLARSPHTVVLQGAACLPAVLWSLERLRSTTAAHVLLIGAVAWACLIFAGHPQMTVYAGFLAAAYVAFFAWRGPPLGRARYAMWSLLTLGAGTALAAVQLLPTHELGAESIRAQLSYSDFISYAMPVRQLPMLLFPFLFGGRAGSAYWGAGTFIVETTCYVGVAPLVLALASLARVRTDPHVRFWLAVAVAALLLALGGATPLALATYHVPLYNSLRAHARTLVLVDCAVAVLAGIALRDMPLRAAWRAAAAVTALVVATIALTLTIGPAIWGWMAARQFGGAPLAALLESTFSLRNPALIAPLLLSVAVAATIALARSAPRAAAALLLALQLIDMRLFDDWYPHTYPAPFAGVSSPYDVQAVAAVEAPPFPFRIASSEPVPHRADWRTATINGYDPLMIRRYAELAGDMQYPGRIAPAALCGTPVFLDLLNVKYVVLPEAKAAPQRVGEVQFGGAPLELTLPPGRSVDFLLSSQHAATSVGIVSALAGAVDVPDGAPVARIAIATTPLPDAAERRTEVLLRAGEHTAARDWDQPDVRAVVRHRRAPVVEWLSGVVGLEGHRYGAVLELPERLEPVRLRIEALQSELNVSYIALYDAPTRASQPVTWLQTFLADDGRWVQRAATESTVVLENRRVLPRAWLVNRTERLAPAQILATLRSGVLPSGERFDPRAVALLEDREGSELAPAGSSGDVEVVRYEPNAIELRTRADGAAFLVLGEVFYPGWEARVDGARVAILRTNYALRGIELGPGSHRVEVVFRPASVRIGAAISVVTLGGLIAFSLQRLTRSSRKGTGCRGSEHRGSGGIRSGSGQSV